MTTPLPDAARLFLAAALLLAPPSPAWSEEEEPAPTQPAKPAPAKEPEPPPVVTHGALAPGEAVLLLKGKVLEQSEVECIAEDLTLVVRPNDVAVKVEYVLRNHAPEVKRVELATPFALGQQEILLNGEKVESVTLGHPEGYGIWIDDEEWRFTERRASQTPDGVDLPRIQGGRLPPDFYLPEREDGSTLPIRFKSSYRWNHFVTPLPFAGDKPVSVRVEFTVPYLSYSRETRLGEVSSPGSFRYLLSTGSNWRGGTVGTFHVSVRAEGIPLSQVDLSGLDFVPNDSGATFDATEFHSGGARDIQVRLSDFERLRLECTEASRAVPFTILERPQGVNRPWLAPAVRPNQPLEIQLDRKRGPDRRPAATKIASPGQRYRIGLSVVSHGKRTPRLKRVRATVSFARGCSGEALLPQRITASFEDTVGEQAQASRGWRYLFFQSPELPSSVRLTVTEVYPGERDDRRLQIDGIIVEREITALPEDDEDEAPATE